MKAFASSGRTAEIMSQYTRIERAKIIGFRNILIHEYFGVKLETVWNATQEKIPILEKETQLVLGEET